MMMLPHKSVAFLFSTPKLIALEMAWSVPVERWVKCYSRVHCKKDESQVLWKGSQRWMLYKLDCYGPWTYTHISMRSHNLRVSLLKGTQQYTVHHPHWNSLQIRQKNCLSTKAHICWNAVQARLGWPHLISIFLQWRLRSFKPARCFTACGKCGFCILIGFRHPDAFQRVNLIVDLTLWEHLMQNMGNYVTELMLRRRNIRFWSW